MFEEQKLVAGLPKRITCEVVMLLDVVLLELRPVPGLHLTYNGEAKSDTTKEDTAAPVTPVFTVGGEGVKLEQDKHVTPMTRKRSSEMELDHDIPSKKLLHMKSDNGLPVIAGDTGKVL
ncbi:hypothetical protein OESDEN_23044 [Oesophagostomum dentatum]|uniref:Uncharacterized protein n=1 Tax=Oesophagostomum dentatum TaxID=61180 RepID=A0A0B1S0A6_OESDE|nr:hypothetical protein OESDEN_23044 [Oesophagostomum dentatum]